MFTFKKQHDLNPIKAVVDEYTHDSGLSLLYIKPTFKQKDIFRFEITFKTFPKDPSGLPHITEHIVLNGSKKYPVKDVFFEVLKYSVTKSLNASTYNYKTTYYFNTPIYKEFLQLMDIYLDSVLAPLITDESVYNEGVLIKQVAKNKVHVSGVVYNEMLGAFNSLGRVVWTALAKQLFKDSNLSWGSGGYPPEIINVTPEKVREFHQKFYRLDNATMYIYGDAKNQEEIIKSLDKVLVQYKRETPNPRPIQLRIHKQPQNKHIVKTFKYQQMGEHAKHHSLICWNLTSLNIDLVDWYILYSIVMHLFSAQCGWIGKKLKQDKIIQTYSADLVSIAVDVKDIDIFIENITSKDFKYVYNKITELFRQAVNDSKKLDLKQAFKNFKDGIKRSIIYKGSPYVSNFIHDFWDYYVFKNKDISDLANGLSNVSWQDFKRVAKLLKTIVTQDPTELRFKPDKNYVKNLKQESIKKAQKLVRSGAKTEKTQENQFETLQKPLITLSTKDVKPELPKLKYKTYKQGNFDFYHIPFKEKYRTQLQLMLNISDIPKVLYIPFYFYSKYLASPVIYKTSYKNIACKRTDGISYIGREDFANYLNPREIKYFLKLGGWIWKNQEKSGLQILRKAIDDFNKQSINLKVLREKLKGHIKDLLENHPENIEQGLVQSVLADRVPFYNISRYMYPGEEFLKYIERKARNITDLVEQIIESIFEVHDYIINHAKPTIFLGTPRQSPMLQKSVLETFGDIFNTGERKDSVFTKLSKAKKENIKKIGLSSGYMRIFGVMDLGVNIMIEQVITDMITSEVMVPLIRFKLKAYGGRFYYDSNYKFWQVRAYRIPTNVSFDKLRDQAFAAIQKFKPNKELIERYKHKFLGRLFRDYDNVSYFYRVKGSILYNQTIEDVKREIKELKAFNVSKFKEIKQKILETEDVRLVGVI